MNHKASAPRPADEDLLALMARLEAAGAESADAVGWHYIRTLAERASAQAAPVQDLLNPKLRQALREMEMRMAQQTLATQATKAAHTMAVQHNNPIAPSPLALLLQDMGSSTAANRPVEPSQGLLPESPRVRQLRQQLRRIGVQKQVSRAMASGPQNAGPINSHMLVLRALGLLRGISPDYLQRFMVHLDTLLCLHDQQAQAATPAARSSRSRKSARA